MTESSIENDDERKITKMFYPISEVDLFTVVSSLFYFPFLLDLIRRHLLTHSQYIFT